MKIGSLCLTWIWVWHAIQASNIVLSSSFHAAKVQAKACTEEISPFEKLKYRVCNLCNHLYHFASKQVRSKQGSIMPFIYEVKKKFDPNRKRKKPMCTQNEKLSMSCQNRCHQNSFMVVIQKVVKVVNIDNQKVVLRVVKKTQSLWQPWQPKSCQQWLLFDNSLTTFRFVCGWCYTYMCTLRKKML